jgi:hypothetical protein
MLKQLPTYSGKAVNFTFTHPLMPVPIVAAGVAARGVRSYSVRMAVEHARMEAGIDGAIAPSLIPGEQGEFEITMFQTSTLHRQLLVLYNLIKVAADAGDASMWFMGTVVMVVITDGTTYTGTGVGPAKQPDKSFTEQAQGWTWRLMACDLQST